MTSVRSRVPPQATADEVLSAAYGWWAPAFASLSPPGWDRAPGFKGMAEQTREATAAAVRHWRGLTELQFNASHEAYRLAASHAEHHLQALTQLMETLWPAPAAARAAEERANV